MENGWFLQVLYIKKKKKARSVNGLDLDLDAFHASPRASAVSQGYVAPVGERRTAAGAAQRQPKQQQFGGLVGSRQQRIEDSSQKVRKISAVLTQLPHEVEEIQEKIPSEPEAEPIQETQERLGSTDRMVFLVKMLKSSSFTWFSGSSKPASCLRAELHIWQLEERKLQAALEKLCLSLALLNSLYMLIYMLI